MPKMRDIDMIKKPLDVLANHEIRKTQKQIWKKQM